MVFSLTINQSRFITFPGWIAALKEQCSISMDRPCPRSYELRDWYIAECARMGQNEVENIPWAYGSFENGDRF